MVAAGATLAGGTGHVYRYGVIGKIPPRANHLTEKLLLEWPLRLSPLVWASRISLPFFFGCTMSIGVCAKYEIGFA